MRVHYALILVLFAASAAKADTVTLTMDEVPNQLINGLTVIKGIESFTFTDPSNTLSYNSAGPGTVTFVQDPSIQGGNVPFSVAFSVPVNFIQFGLAESFLTPLSGALVTLSNGSNLSFDLSLADPFAEGQFTYSGAPVTGFLLTPVSGPGALAFDNLTVTTVPEPLSLLLLGTGLIGVAYRARRRSLS